jgi:hypothetical protein
MSVELFSARNIGIICAFLRLYLSNLLCLPYGKRDLTFICYSLLCSGLLEDFVLVCANVLSYLRYLGVTHYILYVSKYVHNIYLYVEVSGFIIFLGVIWILQETTEVRILRYIILFIGKILYNFFLLNIHIEILTNS